MTEFINSFAHSYDQAFMSAPAIKTIIFMSNAFLAVSILAEIRKEKLTIFHYVLLVFLAIWMIITRTFIDDWNASTAASNHDLTSINQCF